MKINNIKIRIANKNDLSNINHLLLNQDYNFELSDFDNEITKVIVVLYNDSIIGLIKYTMLYERSELEYLFVDERYRGNKIAIQLLNWYIQDVKNHGCYSITLEVNINNFIAINLYEKYQFRVIATRKGYYHGSDAYVMERKMI